MGVDEASRSPHLQRVERLNRLWQVAGPEPTSGSLSHRFLFNVRRMIAAALRPQETFNAAIVEYINATAIERQRLDDLVAECRAAVDETVRHREALAARERRIEAGMSAMRATQDELRISIGVLQQATQTLKHELARVRQPSNGTTSAPAGAGASTAPQGPLDPLAVARDRPLDSLALARDRPAPSALGDKYVGFEDQFRGTSADIHDRLSEYVPIFAGASDVVDLGCGRGEFLVLLQENGISARGVDTNEAMVQICRDKGLRAEAADAVTFLRAQPDQSLGGLFAAQVVEHLEPSYLAALLDAAFDALRPGAPIVLETINVACWFAFFESYIRDVTHVRPLHPDTLEYLLLASGFQRLEIRYRSPYPQHEKLQSITPHAALADWAEALNANVDKINDLLFTSLDYAAIGYRP